MKTMRCDLVQQIVSYREVGIELLDRMGTLNDCGYSIKNIIETVASNNTHNKQGFIIVYECDIPNKCEEERIEAAADEINADQKALVEESKKAVKGLYVPHG